MPKAAGWGGLVGDETAVPIIARALEDFSETTQGKVILFVPHDADMTELPRPSGIELCWVKRTGDEGPLDALRRLEFPPTERYIFFAAEKKEALAARVYLLERGLDRTEFVAATYWKQAQA